MTLANQSHFVPILTAPTAPEGYEQLMEVLNASQNHQAALNAGLKAIEYGSQSPQLFYQVALLYQTLDQLELAYQYYQTCLSLDTHYAPALYNLSFLCFHQKEPIRALEYHERLRNINPKFATMGFYSTLGKHFLESGSYSHALTCWLAAFDFDRSSANALNIGITYRKLGNHERAIEYYKTGLSLDPESSWVTFSLGNVYYDLNRFSEAITYYDKARHLYPGRVEAHIQYASSAAKLEHYDIAIQAALDALLYCQSDRKIYQLLAHIFEQEGHSNWVTPCLQGQIPSHLDQHLQHKNAQRWQPLTSADDYHRHSVHPVQVWDVPLPKTLEPQIHPSFLSRRRYLAETFVAQIADGRAYYRFDPSVATSDHQWIPEVSCSRAVEKLEKLPALQHLGDRAIFIPQRLSDNYYHWTFDTLPRLALIQQAGFEIHPSDRIVVNAPIHPFHQQSLAQLNLSQEQLLFSNCCHITAKELLVPSLLGDSYSTPTPWMCQFLRDSFQPHPLPQPRRRLYLRRGETNYRQVLNEDAVIQLLADYGFEAISPGSLSFPEQVATLAAAEVVVAPHGAGNTNFVYCPPGTAVIEIFSPEYVVDFYWLLSQAAQLDYGYLLGEDLANLPQFQDKRNYFGRHCHDIWVDLEKLRATLASLISIP